MYEKEYKRVTSYQAPPPPPKPTGPYYQPSGRFAVSGLVKMPLAGLIVVAVLGPLYGGATAHNPLWFFNFIIALIYGTALGFGLFFGLEWGKVRSRKIAVASALVLGAMAVYVGWVVWTHGVLYDRGRDDWPFRPLALIRAMADLAQAGGHYRFWQPSATTLYILWIMEAAVIVGAAMVVVWSNLVYNPFCEGCEEWTKTEFEDLRLGHYQDPALLKGRLEKGEMAALVELGPPSADAYTLVGLSLCQKCQKLGFLKVNGVTISRDQKGKERPKTEELMNNLILRNQELETVRGLKAGPGPAKPAPLPPRSPGGESTDSAS